MANFTDSRINQTYQRIVQVDGAVIQDGKGNVLSGSMGDLTVSGSLNIIGHTNVSASLSRLDNFSSSIDDTFATDADVTAVSSRVSSLENFSSSLDGEYATDAQLTLVSSSLATETAQLLDFSASLDATFATDAQLTTAVEALNASTSSLAHKNAISGAFAITSASLANQIATLDSEYASDTQLTNLSSSVANTYLSKQGKIIISSSAQLFGVCDTRYANSGSYTALSGSFLQLSSSLQSDYVLSSSFALLSSSLQADFLGETEWQIASASLRNDISYDSARVSVIENKTLISSSTQIFNIADSRYGFTPYDARYANINSISGSFALEAAKITALQTVVSASAVVNLTPSATLPTNVSTGSLAVTGSTLAFYDGNNWKVVITGSTLPL